MVLARAAEVISSVPAASIHHAASPRERASIAMSCAPARNKLFDQTKIKNVIVTQLLTLDDDDGDLSNGTPHYYEINRAFRDQGFPGVWIPTLPVPVPK